MRGGAKSLKYIDLDLDHKKELLVNLKALSLVIYSLQNLTGVDLNVLIKEVFEKTYDEISALPDKVINDSIADIEKNRVPFTEPGRAVML